MELAEKANTQLSAAEEQGIGQEEMGERMMVLAEVYKTAADSAGQEMKKKKRADLAKVAARGKKSVEDAVPDAEEAALEDEEAAYLDRASEMLGKAAVVMGDSETWMKKAEVDQKRGDSDAAMTALNAAVQTAESEEDRVEAQEDLEKLTAQMNEAEEAAAAAAAEEAEASAEDSAEVSAEADAVGEGDPSAESEQNEGEEDARVKVRLIPFPDARVTVYHFDETEEKRGKKLAVLKPKEDPKYRYIDKLPEGRSFFYLTAGSRYYPNIVSVDGTRDSELELILAWRPKKID